MLEKVGYTFFSLRLITAPDSYPYLKFGYFLGRLLTDDNLKTVGQGLRQEFPTVHESKSSGRWKVKCPKHYQREEKKG
jgi:hypothetical protein